MKAPLVIIGTILIIVAFVIMGLFIIGPAIAPSLDSVPPMKAILQTMLCKSGEKLTADYSTYSTHPGNTTRSVEMSCVNNENQARDVSGQGILYGMVGYLIPFLTGLFMVIIGSGGRRRRYVLSSSATFTPTSDMVNQPGMFFENAGYQVSVGADGKVEIKMPDGKVYTPQNMPGMPAGFAAMSGNLPQINNMTQRLQELKSMFDAGLITESEYEKKKQEILKQL